MIHTQSAITKREREGKGNGRALECVRDCLGSVVIVSSHRVRCCFCLGELSNSTVPSGCGFSSASEVSFDWLTKETLSLSPLVTICFSSPRSLSLDPTWILLWLFFFCVHFLCVIRFVFIKYSKLIINQQKYGVVGTEKRFGNDDRTARSSPGSSPDQRSSTWAAI